MIAKFFLLSSLVSMLALSSCGQIIIEGQVLTAEEAAERHSERAADQAAVSSPDQPDVAYASISFSYDPALASAVRAETVPAQDDPEAPFWAIVPQHVRFSFDQYSVSDTLHQPQLLVYPVEEFEAINPAAAKTIADLKFLLATRPTSAPEPGSDVAGIPALPIFNAAQELTAGMEYIDFQNGSGVRFLTQYAQGIVPINNHELVYSFQGLTDDQRYYVAAILPVSHPILPNEASSTGDEDFAAYLSETVQRLNAQANASFTPDLALLDALIRSLTVG